MTATTERPSLRTFLVHTDSRTGERFEAAALAEMAGYTVADAQAAGSPDIFTAALSTPMRLDQRMPKGTLDTSSGLRAFARGLAYTAPVLAIWALFPSPITQVEVKYLALAVVLSWGGSMAVNHIVGTWIHGDPRAGWRFAAFAAVAATAIAILVGEALVRLEWIGRQTAVIAVLQVVYFFSASPLMLRRGRVVLGLLATIGAFAGLLLLLEPWPEVVWQWSGAHPTLQLTAAACLAAPGVILIRQAAAVRHSKVTPRSDVVGRDVVAFGAYGAFFGCLILWGPVVVPGSAVTMLSLVVVAGIAFAEMSVALVRQRLDRLLNRAYDPATFPRRARWIVLSGAAAYVLPAGLGVMVAFMVAGDNEPLVVRGLSVIAVIGLGAVQVFSLLGMSLHGIRWVSAALTTCGLALLLTTPHLHDAPSLVLGYVIVVVILWIWLMVTVTRLSVHPINLI